MTTLANATAIVTALEDALNAMESAEAALGAAHTFIRQEDEVADDTVPNINALLRLLTTQVEAARVEWDSVETNRMED